MWKIFMFVFTSLLFRKFDFICEDYERDWLFS